ncbi:MAG: hypothetical protein AB1564_05680 [Chloroflexota bacterium]
MKKILALILFSSILLAACAGAPTTASPPLLETPTQAPQSQPLTLESDSETIRLKLLYSHTNWQTIWLDGVVTWNAPEGLDAPAQVYRQQVWVDQPNFRFRYVNGPADGEPDFLRVSDGQNILETNLTTGQSLPSSLPDFVRAPFEPPSVVTDTVYPHPLEGQIGSPFGALILPAGLGQRSGTYVPINLETVLGRETLVVEWSPQPGLLASRYWVDTQTGVILRAQDFGKGGGEVIQNEYVINSIEFDQPLADSLFLVEPVSSLAFTDITGAAPTPEVPAATPTVEVSPADLGEVYFFTLKKDGTNAVELVRLPGSCVTVQTVCPPLEIVETPFALDFNPAPLAWSPHGTLAAFAAPSANGMSLYLYKPQDGSWTPLAEFSIIDLPAWSSDGTWIAFRVQDGQGGGSVQVIHRDGTGLRDLTASADLPAEGRPYVLNGWVGENVILRSGQPGNEGLIYIARAEDGYVRTLYDTLLTKAELVPSFGGDFFAYDDYDYASQQHILSLLTPEGNVREQLATFTTTIYPIVWSPDGNSLAFNVYGADPAIQTNDVYIIRRDGTGLGQVYRGAAVFSLHFSPDGKYLLVEDSTNTGRHLFVIALETLEQFSIDAPGLSLSDDWMMASWRP